MDNGLWDTSRMVYNTRRDRKRFHLPWTDLELKTGVAFIEGAVDTDSKFSYPMGNTVT